MQCIYPFTPQEADIVGNSQMSSSEVNSMVSFFMVPHKSSSCLWLFPFPPYDNFNKPLPPCSSRSQKDNNYDMATYILYSNLCLFTSPPVHWLSLKSLATEVYYCKNGVSQIHPPISGDSLSNNISKPLV